MNANSDIPVPPVPAPEHTAAQGEQTLRLADPAQAAASEAAATVAAAQELSDSRFLRRTLLVTGLFLFTGLTLTVFWYASDVLLVLFAGILMGVLLRAPTNWLSARTGMRQGMALGATIGTLALVVLILVSLFARPMAEQIAQLIETLPQAMERAEEWMSNYRWARPLQPLLAEISNFRLDTQLLGRASGLITSIGSAVGGLIVVIFIGIYLAAQPRLYQRGVMHLLPRRARPRAYEVMDEIGRVLRAWLLGRLVTMAVVGAAAGIGLWWLGVPQAFTLGVLTGLLEFVPYIGPILSAGAPLLIALNIDPELAFYVALLYVGIQSAENYLLSPLIEQRAVALPPALVMFSTLLLAVLAGPLGVLLASPLTATGIVAVKLLYVEDVVENPAKT